MNAFIKAIVTTAVTTVQVLALLIIELMLAMIIYVYLALYDLETFGWLVRQAGSVLNIIWDQMNVLFSEAALNQAYATVVGELQPKSMLLLLIGLAVGALLRFFGWMVIRLMRGLTRRAA